MEDRELLLEVQEVVNDLKIKSNNLKDAADLVVGEEKDKANELAEKVIMVLVNASNKIVDSVKNNDDKLEIENGISIVKRKSEELYEHALNKINNLNKLTATEETKQEEIQEEIQEEVKKEVEEIVEEIAPEINNEVSQVSLEETKVENTQEVIEPVEYEQTIQEEAIQNDTVVDIVNNLKQLNEESKTDNVVVENNIVEPIVENTINQENNIVEPIVENTIKQETITVEVADLVSPEMNEKAINLLSEWLKPSEGN